MKTKIVDSDFRFDGVWSRNFAKIIVDEFVNRKEDLLANDIKELQTSLQNVEEQLKQITEENKSMRGSKDRPELNIKKELKVKVVTWIVAGLVLMGMLYFALFVGLKDMSFFGASTENTQALW